MAEQPLTDAELRTLRGMIDEYRFAERRRLLWSQRAKSWRVVTLFVLGATLYALQLVIAFYAIRGR